MFSDGESVGDFASEGGFAGAFIRGGRRFCEKARENVWKPDIGVKRVGLLSANSLWVSVKPGFQGFAKTDALKQRSEMSGVTNVVEHRVGLRIERRPDFSIVCCLLQGVQSLCRVHTPARARHLAVPSPRRL